MERNQQPTLWLTSIRVNFIEPPVWTATLDRKTWRDQLAKFVESRAALVMTDTYPADPQILYASFGHLAATAGDMKALALEIARAHRY